MKSYPFHGGKYAHMNPNLISHFINICELLDLMGHSIQVESAHKLSIYRQAHHKPGNKKLCKVHVIKL